MNKEIKNIDSNKILKDKLYNVELPFDNKEWTRFKKSVPGKANLSLLYVVVASVIIISGISTYFIIHEKKSDNVVSENTLTEVTYNNDNNQNKTDVETNDKNSENKLSNIDNRDSEAIKQNDQKDDTQHDSTAVVTETEDSVNDSSGSVINHNQIQQEGEMLSSFSIIKSDNCTPVSVKFIPDLESDSVIYYWEFGDGTFSNDIKPVHTYNAKGNYQPALTIKYFNSEKIYTTRYKSEIVVYETPEAKYNYNKIDDKKYRFVVEDADQLNVSWIIDQERYNTAECFHNFYNEGEYKVKLIVENNEGCISVSEQMINITVDFNVFMPNIFSPDNDGKNDFFGPVTEYKDIEEYLFNIYDSKGNIVFSSDDINRPWDGIIMNTTAKAEQGKYFWEYYIKTNSGNVKKQKGILLVK